MLARRFLYTIPPNTRAPAAAIIPIASPAFCPPFIPFFEPFRSGCDGEGSGGSGGGGGGGGDGGGGGGDCCGGDRGGGEEGGIEMSGGGAQCVKSLKRNISSKRREKV
ncbi:unnamed protein product [Camellia sinensis]